MDRNEKKRIRDYIGEHLDVSGTRLTVDEAIRLRDFIDQYDESYKGRSETRRSTTLAGVQTGSSYARRSSPTLSRMKSVFGGTTATTTTMVKAVSPRTKLGTLAGS